MLRSFFWLPTIVLVALAHVALSSAFSVAGVPCTYSRTNFALGCRPATLQWYSRKSMWWFFTRKYKHIFTFRHDTRYGGTMEYESKDFGKRCHEDGVWCVEHSDSVYQGVTVFFNGSTYQHQNWTQNCITDNYDFCVEYIDYVTIKTT